MIRHLAFALAVAAAAVPAASFAAHPAIDRSGGTLVIDQQDGQTPLVGIAFAAPAGLDRQTLSQNGLAALTAETILRTPVSVANGSPTPLEDAVSAHGGAITMSITQTGARFYIETLPEDAAALLTAFSTALAHPDFSNATLASAKTSLSKRIAQTDSVAFDVGVEMLDHAAAAKGDPGFAPLGNSAALAQRLPADVRAFYTKYYVRGGSVVSAVGRTDTLPAGALHALASALPPGETAAVKASLPVLAGASHSLIAHRDIPAPWLLARYPAPPVGSKDFGPFLVLTAFVEHALSDIAEVPGVVTPTAVSRSIGAMYAYDHDRGSLTVYVNGGIGSPNRAFATALSLVGVLAATPLQGNIDEFKASAYGDFISGATSLEARAWTAVLFAQDGASSDYLEHTMAAIGDTKTSDLERVAKKYLTEPTIALVLPRSTVTQP